MKTQQEMYLHKSSISVYAMNINLEILNDDHVEITGQITSDLHSICFVWHIQLLYCKCRLTWWFSMFANCCIRWTIAHVHFLLPLDSNGTNTVVFANFLGNSSDTRRRAMTNPVNWKAHSLKTWFRFHNLCFARKKWEKDSLLW